MQRRIQLGHVNPFLTCTICTGYLVDATTIVECLHSFCRSCIIRHLETSYNCPKCNTEIHKTKPYDYIRSDPSLQEVIYKLVPDLYNSESTRKHTWTSQNSVEEEGDDDDEKEENTRILVTLKYFRGTSRMERIKTERVLKMFPTRYLCCQPEMPVRVLKKFVRYKFDINMDLFNLEIWRGDETLLDNLTLKQLIQIFGLFRERKPLELHYSFFPKFAMKSDSNPPLPTLSTEISRDENVVEKTSPSPHIDVKENTVKEDTSMSPNTSVAFLDEREAISMETEAVSMETDSLNNKTDITDGTIENKDSDG